MAFRGLVPLLRPRLYSTAGHAFNLPAVDAWIAQPKTQALHDTLHPERLAKLHVTLPTRDGRLDDKPLQLPQLSSKLDYGHHLIFFHTYTPERHLLPNGTDADVCPPAPFTRRMWASGTMEFNNENPLLVGDRAIYSAHLSSESIRKRGFDEGRPRLFCNQTITYTKVGHNVPSLTETRTHVFLPPSTSTPSSGAPSKSKSEYDTLTKDYSFSYTPSPVTLFRYSALIFNAHHIHLDKEYAQQSEGYAERLVHGPLTANMLLETAILSRPEMEVQHFDYRARNPMVVNQPQHFHVHWKDDSHAVLWCTDDAGIVGMTGNVVCTI